LQCAALLAVFFLSVIYLKTLNKFLGSKPLVFLGEISLSLYLNHLFVLNWMKWVGLLDPSFFSFLLGLLLTVLVSWATLVLFEKPSQEFVRSWILDRAFRFQRRASSPGKVLG
jgi:peptidoglycan/LPS O-acetylase OafA/YrhL